jgi:hypothetical protein
MDYKKGKPSPCARHSGILRHRHRARLNICELERTINAWQPSIPYIFFTKHVLLSMQVPSLNPGCNM